MFLKLFQKLRRSRLLMTILFFYTVYLLIYSTSSHSKNVTKSAKASANDKEVSTAENNINNHDDSIFKDADVPKLIDFDLYDVVNFVKSKFQNPEKLFAKLLRSIDSDDFTMQGLDIVPSFFKYSDYDIKVPDKQFLAQNMDIRITIAAYLKYIKDNYDNRNENVEIPFHWYDWVDLTAMNEFVRHNDEEQPSEKLEFDCASLAIADKNQNYKKFCRNHDDLKAVFPDYKQNENAHLDFNVFKWSTRSTEDLKILQGKSYLYSTARTPVSIVFMTNTSSEETYDNIGIYEFKVKNGNTVGNAERLSENYESFVGPFEEGSTVNPLFHLDAFANSYSSSKKDPFPLSEDHQLTLSTKFFKYNTEEVITSQEKKLAELDETSLDYTRKQNHLNSLKFSDSLEEVEIKKYFHEVPIYESVAGALQKSKAGSHYDWRFFSGLIQSDKKTRRVLHHLTRSFLKLTFAKRLPAWVAHGSLLSWYWNSVNFPWDSDVDVQMSIYHLQKFCEAYNQSLVVENLYDGLGRYFVDCGSSLTHRTKGLGKNNIDARFIDVDSGMYIDITGLALSSEQLPMGYTNLRKRKLIEAPKQIKPATIIHTYDDGLTSEQRYANNERLLIYNCKNKHFAFHQQIAPLKLAHFEGVLTFIPNSYEALLNEEYHSDPLNTRIYSNHFFSKSLRQWIEIDKLKNYFHMKIKHSSHYKNGLTINLLSLDKNYGDLVEFLQFDESVLYQFARNEYITKKHESEMSKGEVLMFDFKPNFKDLFLVEKLASPDAKQLPDSNVMMQVASSGASDSDDDEDDD